MHILGTLLVIVGLLGALPILPTITERSKKKGWGPERSVVTILIAVAVYIAIYSTIVKIVCLSMGVN